MLLPEEERTPRFYPSDWRHLEFDSLLMKNTALAIRRRPLSDTNETDFVVVKDAMVFRRIDGDSIDGDAGAERILRRAFEPGRRPPRSRSSWRHWSRSAIASNIGNTKRRPDRSKTKTAPEGAVFLSREPAVGIEPTTARLRIECSTTELRWQRVVLTTHALARTRTATPCGTTPSRWRVYQFHHQGI